MHRSRLRLAALLALVAALVAATSGPAGAASSVAYIDNYNLWLSSPDGTQKLQVTQGGTDQAPWQQPASGADGKTVVVHRDTFEGGSTRPVLYLYGADGKLVTANVMPVYSGATIPVYPIGLDMDWNSQAVAYGYSYCGFACNTLYQGFWLTFSDNQGLYPTNPQGQSDAYDPTFYGRRVMFSDSGGNLFVQPDVAEAPFTSSYTGWLDHPTRSLRRVAASPVGRTVGIEWSEGNAAGIMLGQHQGTIPSDVTEICELATAAGPARLTFSPDGTMIAWADAEGVKVAGAPNLTGGGGTCALSAPPRVIAATGSAPDFGGTDVGAILKPSATTPPAGSGGSQPGGAGTPGAPTPTPATPAKPAPLAVRLSGKATTTLFARGKLKLQVTAKGAGRIDATATIPAAVGRRLKLRAAGAAALGPRGLLAAAARPVVVARGRATARRAGRVTIALRPTSAARRRATRLRGVTLSVKVAQGTATGTVRIRLR